MPSLTNNRNRSRGQSLVELTLVLPVLLLLLLFVVDFGRIYLGYVNMQQMARVAAGFAAEHASAWDSPQNTDVLDRYQDMIETDATALNCDPVRDEVTNRLPDPEFIDRGFSLGDRVEVRINCAFGVLTPVISSILGGTVDLTADIVYPIREGMVAEVPGGGNSDLTPAVADFVGSPQSGYGPLEVTFFDDSTNATTWDWGFGNGTAHTEGPHVIEYSCPPSVLPGESCQFDVSLRAGGLGGSDTETKTNYITVYVPPESGPIAEFEGSPRFGSAPLTVNFQFVDVRRGDVTYTNYQWDFTNNGDFEQEGADKASVSYTYPNVGVYAVRLVVTDDSGGVNPPQPLFKLAYVVVKPPVCTVPDFGNKNRSSAQGLWDEAGFTTTVQTLPAGGNNPNRDYKIHSQSLLGGTIDPQPDGCDATITVGP